MVFIWKHNIRVCAGKMGFLDFSEFILNLKNSKFDFSKPWYKKNWVLVRYMWYINMCLWHNCEICLLSVKNEVFYILSVKSMQKHGLGVFWVFIAPKGMFFQFWFFSLYTSFFTFSFFGISQVAKNLEFLNFAFSPKTCFLSSFWSSFWSFLGASSSTLFALHNNIWL